MSVKLKSELSSTLENVRASQQQQNNKIKKAKLSPIDKLWTLLFALAFTDVVISYLGNSLHLPILPQPWLLIIVPFSILMLFSIHDILKIKVIMAEK